MIRVVVLDDEALVRSGLALILDAADDIAGALARFEQETRVAGARQQPQTNTVDAPVSIVVAPRKSLPWREIGYMKEELRVLTSVEMNRSGIRLRKTFEICRIGSHLLACAVLSFSKALENAHLLDWESSESI